MADDTAIQQIKIPITETKHRLKKSSIPQCRQPWCPPPPPTPRIIEPPALIRGHPRGTGKWPLNSGWSLIRDEPLENLWGGGGEVPKKYSRKGTLNEKKIHVR